MAKNTELYDVLAVSPSATLEEIKRAFRLRALQSHPDKNPEGHERFIAVRMAYEVLSDPRQRKQYDRTGCTHDVSEDNLRYWVSVRINEEDILQYMKDYKEGSEELKDVLEFYVSHKGDVTSIEEFVISAEPENIERLLGIIEKAVAEGTVEDFKLYHESVKKLRRRLPRLIRKRQRERDNFKDEKNLPSDESLALLIQNRQKSREDATVAFLDGLADKYTGKRSAKRRRKMK
ncbi:MAG: uncharacterized protein KVP18_001939 [Porospora cf. gigantea A]|uniref:uncharacterized protein n=1 Tax=Porospora cf. gigantea A TaxID=2853593 RepID=UPI0035593AE2|nr:MAG: hypothetical protein KVP18_001939 [Porospora cf. gigantea A]